jgi:hypothetical protein
MAALNAKIYAVIVFELGAVIEDQATLLSPRSRRRLEDIVLATTRTAAHYGTSLDDLREIAGRLGAGQR